MASGRVLLRVDGAARLVGVDARAGDVLRALANAIGDFARALVALVPEVERNHHAADVHLGAAPEAARAREDAACIAVFDLLHRDLLDLTQLPVEILDARAFGRRDEDLHHAAVFLRREFARQAQTGERKARR